MNSKKVWILPGDSRGSAEDMFLYRDWTVCGDSADDMNLICFLGGTDVDPAIYGAERHPKTQSPDKARDKFEVEVFNKFKDIPKVGICRGGQLLNVLNGGKMIQHLGSKSGLVEIAGYEEPCGPKTKELGKVLVDHHQGIVAKNGYERAWPHYREFLEGTSYDNWPSYVVHYPETKSLCFQPHPEWGHKPTEDYFFELLEQTLGFTNE